LTLPHDLDLEAAVVGWLLVDRAAVAEAVWLLSAADFYSPKHQAIYAALVGEHERGERGDARTVLAACAGQPVTASDLVELTHTGSPSWKVHAETLAELTARRKLAGAASEVLQAVTSGVPAAEAADMLTGALAEVANPVGSIPGSLLTAGQVADRVVEQADWIIPGMLRRGWRAVVVAPEGVGKSLLLLQCALLASAGIHPLHYREMRPVVSLLVDLENPGDEVTARVASMRKQVGNHTSGQWDDLRPWVWEEPGGIDLRSRHHRSRLDAICSQVRPDLVCIGPVYKAYQKRDGERGHEDGVRHLQTILDDLRTRHRFALVLEHHAPMDASNGASSKRVLRPSDTMLWLRWPEIGIGLTPDEKNPQTVMHCRRWRGDRVKAEWPTRIEYGQTFPWVGVWPTKGAA
jgi:hypothetical protein